MSRVRAAALLTAMLLPGTAGAQIEYREAPPTYMREGQPAVQTPVGRADPQAGIRSRFRSSYAAAKSPRIVVFWNREFTDEVATNYDVVATNATVAAAASDSAAVAGRRGRYGAAAESSRAVAASVSETRVGLRANTDTRRYSENDEIGDFDEEQGFTSVLRESGVRLIDRTSIMRTTGAARNASDGANIQGIETEAILAKADVIVEVTQMGSSGGHAQYRIIARDLRKSKILASFRTDGAPPPSGPRYVAGPDGFERAVETQSDDGVGRQLAVDFMSRVTGTF